MSKSSSLWSKVVVFLGSTRENRLGDRVAKFVVSKLKQKNIEVVLIDPLEITLPILTKPAHFYRAPDKAPQNLLDVNTQIDDADAIIVVSAEYNHSMPPGLINTMDYFGPKSYSYKPSGIVTYSPSLVGGARAGVQLRSFLGELGCISVSNMFAIPRVHKALDENGIPQETEEGSHMDSGCDKLLTQLEWWANAAKVKRNEKTN